MARLWKQVSLLIFASLLIFSQCGPGDHQLSDELNEFQEGNIKAPRKSLVNRDLQDIRKDGTLKAIVGYGSTSYFTYKGQAMGYEYELLTRLADKLGVKLEIVVAHNYDEMFTKLNTGQGDLIAFGLTITESRKNYVAFTEYHTTTEQVLVQRKPDNWRQIPTHVSDRQLIRNPLDLLEKEVYVRKSSSYFERLQNLGDEMGGEINIKTVAGDVSTEQLIGKVQNKEIPCTVADKHIALLNSTYYTDLDVNTKISFPQRLAWAVRKNSPALLTEVDKWISSNRGSETFNVIFNRYFRDTKSFRRRKSSPFFSKSGGQISEYDNIVKEASKSIDWDWRLLSSLIFQESRFDPNATSWAGAVGLMQMLPSTAKAHGAKNFMDPEESLKAGVSYLGWLQNFWKEIEDPEERLKFVLASYNAGQGHVKDAQRLAKKYKKDPRKWDDNVAVYILKKANKEYYTQDVVKHGYCRGEEPFNYVTSILDNYRIYRDLIPE
ncbi:MAG: transporter substrate-binding domain-containing protein [Cytophagaceae bacterium]